MYCKKCGSQIADDSVFCSVCGANLGESSPKPNNVAVVNNNEVAVSQKTSLNPDKLDAKGTMTYLENVCKLENDKFALKQTKESLQNKIRRLGHPENIDEPDIKSLVYFDELFAFIFGAILPIMLLFDFTVGLIIIWFTSFKFIIGLTLGVMAIVAVIDSTISVIKNSIHNNKEKKRYEYESSKDRHRLHKENQQIDIYKQHISKIDSQISALNKTLDKLYDYDILYKKYRGNVVAVNTIYDYFKAGRVTSLSAYGFDIGAYNLYENELRQNIIIDKLDVIITKLEELKNIMYMLYDAVKDAMNVMDRISSMADKVSEISQNTALTAYNSKVIADNTSVLSYIESMNYLRSYN